jgi:translation initiation factor 1
VSKPTKSKGDYIDPAGKSASPSPFAALAALKDSLPAVPPSAPDREVQGEVPVKQQPGPRRAVVRLERKGRGGKAVTLVSHLALDAVALERWSKELRQALGVGGAVEDGVLVFQGDQRERVAALLTARGVGQVTVS